MVSIRTLWRPDLARFPYGSDYGEGPPTHICGPLAPARRFVVGLSRNQIEAFHWDPDAPRFQAGFETLRVREHLAKVNELRGRIQDSGDEVSDWEMRDLWDEAQSELRQVPALGRSRVASYLDAENTKDRERKRGDFASAVVSGNADRYRGWIEEGVATSRYLAPFHWEIEFPRSWGVKTQGSTPSSAIRRF